MKLIVVAFIALLAGCDASEQRARTPEPDQCMRREIFKECLALIPKGPQSVHNSNDWQEVVAECGEVALYQSKRQPEFIKPECRAYK